MTELPKSKMTVDEYLIWADGRQGRYELVDGEIVAMSPERSRHAETKFAIRLALREGIRRSGLPYWMLPGGMTVRISERTAYEPDALIYCGSKLPPDAVEVPNPVIVVEVLSPNTKHIDKTAKLTGYFSLASVHRYLVLDTEKNLIIHHARQVDDVILTKIVRNGELNLSPPGLELQFSFDFGEFGHCCPV